MLVQRLQKVEHLLCRFDDERTHLNRRLDDILVPLAALPQKMSWFDEWKVITDEATADFAVKICQIMTTTEAHEERLKELEHIVDDDLDSEYDEDDNDDVDNSF